jgi:hypothetical protein
VNGTIIVYGGFFSSNDIPYNTPAKETIAMLDIYTLVWSIPPFDSRSENLIPKLAFHTASVMKTIMYIAFGKFAP